jgi:hypothetical protein
MTLRRALAYGAAGAAAAVTITAAVTGSFVPHQWPEGVIPATFVSAIALSFGIAAIAESVR